MTATEGDVRTDASTGRGTDRPGSTASRLAEASHQLEIVLEEVDLEDDPDLGDAVVSALVDVQSAATLLGRDGATSDA